MESTNADDLIRERDAWKETAAQHCRNEQYYRGLLVKIGETFGKVAYTSDDGSVQDSVLCAKVPELVHELRTTALNLCHELQCPAMEYMNSAVQTAWSTLFDFLDDGVGRVDSPIHAGPKVQ